MNNPNTECDPRRIEQCLADSFSAEERTAFESHLDVCAACRLALESSAADATDWSAAREFLSSHDRPISESDQIAAETDAAGIEAVIAALGPTDDPRMLGRLGAYEIAGVVGRGGMGVVLKGFDPALNRYVAIKVLAPHLAMSGAARQRFAREARAAASVVHENVVAIHAVADAGPAPFFVMPYIRGASLEKRLEVNGPLGVAEVLRVARQIAAGLAAAHAQGLVHRDIKPSNVLLDDGVERLQITDFGLARAADDASLTRTGVIAGTPQFMSPEQARGELVDARSDLFSLASVMYAMCTGRPPFRAETSYGILRRICDDTPRPIRETATGIPEWLELFVARLHAKNAADRFQTAAEVSVLLEQCLAHLEQPTTVALPPAVAELVVHPADRRRTRRTALLGGLAALAAMLLVAVVLFRNSGSIANNNSQSTSDHETTSAASPPPRPSRERGPGGEGVAEPRSFELRDDDPITEELRALQFEIQDLETRILDKPNLESPQPQHQPNSELPTSPSPLAGEGAGG